MIELEKTRIRKENIRFGKLVKKRLVDMNMTSKELAGILDIDPRYISKIVRGERSGLKYRKRIMEILKMEALWYVIVDIAKGG